MMLPVPVNGQIPFVNNYNEIQLQRLQKSYSKKSSQSKAKKSSDGSGARAQPPSIALDLKPSPSATYENLSSLFAPKRKTSASSSKSDGTRRRSSRDHDAEAEAEVVSSPSKSYSSQPTLSPNTVLSRRVAAPNNTAKSSEAERRRSAPSSAPASGKGQNQLINFIRSLFRKRSTGSRTSTDEGAPAPSSFTTTTPNPTPEKGNPTPNTRTHRRKNATGASSSSSSRSKDRVNPSSGSHSTRKLQSSKSDLKQLRRSKSYTEEAAALEDQEGGARQIRLSLRPRTGAFKSPRGLTSGTDAGAISGQAEAEEALTRRLVGNQLRQMHLDMPGHSSQGSGSLSLASLPIPSRARRVSPAITASRRMRTTSGPGALTLPFELAPSEELELLGQPLYVRDEEGHEYLVTHTRRRYFSTSPSQRTSQLMSIEEAEDEASEEQELYRTLSSEQDASSAQSPSRSQTTLDLDADADAENLETESEGEAEGGIASESDASSGNELEIELATEAFPDADPEADPEQKPSTLVLSDTLSEPEPEQARGEQEARAASSESESSGTGTGEEDSPKSVNCSPEHSRPESPALHSQKVQAVLS